MLARILNRKIEHVSHYYCIGLKFLQRVQFSLQRSQPPRMLITGVTVTATNYCLSLSAFSYTRPLLLQLQLQLLLLLQHLFYFSSVTH